jgi:hypothetical protein
MISCVLVSSSGISLNLVQMATPNVTHIDQTYPFAHQNLVEALKLLVIVCVCNILL